MLLGISCQKEDNSFENTENQNFKIENRTIETENRRTNYTQIRPVVLGDEYINPYEIGKVNQAIADLYPNSTPVQPTHKYVKFSPNDHQDLADILDWAHSNGIVMFDHPLTYEIIEEGDYYIDPKVSDEALSPQYCSIDVSLLMPNAPNEILQELYLDESNPFIFIETYTNTGHTDKIRTLIGDGIPFDVVTSFMPVSFPCNINELPDPPICGSECEVVLMFDDIVDENGNFGVCYWDCYCPIDVVTPVNNCGCPTPLNSKTPSGCVQVQNDFNADEPVRIAKIAVWDWNFIFKKSDITYTDERGCWRLNRQYDECRMKVIFENDNLKVRSMKYWASLRVLRDRTRVFNNTPYNNINILFNSVIDRREWAASHTLNTDFLYREEAFNDNIAQPRKRLNYHIYPTNTPGSAPMLQGIGNPLGLPFVNQTLPDFLPTISDLLPDITNNYGVSESARRFNSTGYHELAHASHYSLVGETYWTDFRNHVIENNGDGTFPFFNSPNPGVVALGEAIAEYFEANYGSFVNGEGNTWRSNFIPAGLLWDLEDGVNTIDRIRNPDNNTIILATDNIEGFTPEMYFNVLTPGVRTIRSFRDNLSAAHISETPNTLNNYNNFVDAYDVFN